MMRSTGLAEVIHADLTTRECSPTSSSECPWSPINVDDDSVVDMIRQPSWLVASMINEAPQPGKTSAPMDRKENTRSVMISCSYDCND